MDICNILQSVLNSYDLPECKVSFFVAQNYKFIVRRLDKN